MKFQKLESAHFTLQDNIACQEASNEGKKLSKKLKNEN